jgi:hypothetical protein
MYKPNLPVWEILHCYTEAGMGGMLRPRLRYKIIENRRPHPPSPRNTS